METCKLCSRKVYIKKYGFCSKHYSRYIKHGNPHGGNMSWIITMVAVMTMSFVYIIIKGGDEGTPQ